MSDLLASLAESLAGAAADAAERKWRMGRSASRQPLRPQQPPQAPVIVAPPKAVETAGAIDDILPAPPPALSTPGTAPPQPPPRQLDVRQLFGGPNALLRTVIAQEVLSPPLAVRRHNLWDAPSV